MAWPAREDSVKRTTPVDISSKILRNVDAATLETTTAALVHGWIEELEESIQETKMLIHDRIQKEFSQFQRQLESSKSVQTRYETLAARVDEMDHTVFDTETGIHSSLVKVLSKRSALAQDTRNAEVLFHSVSSLVSCRNAYMTLDSFVQSGRLPEATEAALHVESQVTGVPDFLEQIPVFEDLKQKLSLAKARIQDQLSDAYTRSVTVSAREIIILPQVQVRLSETILPLSAMLHSLNSASLSNHLAIFRRDLMARFIDVVLQNPYSISVRCTQQECKLSLATTSSLHENLATRFDNLSIILKFLVDNFFPHFPLKDFAQFRRSLSKSISNSALDRLLIPTLPSSFGLLSSFLVLLQRAVVFEEHDISRLLGKENAIKAWSEGVAGHYERRRRVDILETARAEILHADDYLDLFNVAVEDQFTNSDENNTGEFDAWGLDEQPSSNVGAENAWNFDDGPISDAAVGDANGWDFNETINGADAGNFDGRLNHSAEISPSRAAVPDAWGWDDEKETDGVVEDSAWDDPWAEDVPLMKDSPKAATRLAKKSGSIQKQNGHSDLPLSIPITNAMVPATSGQKEEGTSSSRENYLMPKRTKNITKMVETVIDESKLLSASNLFGKMDMVPPLGSILSQSATSILDLYRAVYPIKHAKVLENPKNAFLFSNSCLYISCAIQRIEEALYGQPSLKEHLEGCRHNLRVSSDSWFDETIERQRNVVHDLLDAAKGFADTSDQDRYDECETAVNSVLQKIKWLAQQLKGVLSKSKYYTVIGLVADASLSRILQDILALPDITEVESLRLSELCRILNALEGLFSGKGDEPPFAAVYIPHWLKFSYLSELMEASLADITYLFEQGALVDFAIEELVKLVRALFADTHTRTNTINKLLNGHPGSS